MLTDTAERIMHIWDTMSSASRSYIRAHAPELGIALDDILDELP